MNTLEERLASNTPIVVIHPGFKYYSTDEYGNEYMSKFEGYENYISNLKNELKKADEENTPIIIFYDPEQDNSLDITKKILGDLKGAVYLPVLSRYWHNSPYNEGYVKLFNKVKEHTNNLKVCGEWRGGCVSTWSLALEYGSNFKIQKMDELIFPSEQQLITHEENTIKIKIVL